MRFCAQVAGLIAACCAAAPVLGQAPAPADAAVGPIGPLPSPLGFFPVAVQFSPVPSGKGWKGEEGPLSRDVIRDTIENILDHGVTGIEGPTHRPPEEEAYILEYAQSRGMFITWHAGALEGFGRDKPPEPCVYSPSYAAAVQGNVERSITPLASIPRLYNVFAYQDEPFTAGPASFGYNDDVKAEFRERYGYDLPPDLASVRDDPRRWQQVTDFRTAKFPDGWRQVYRAIKKVNPNFRVTMTHDSHNTFGAGYGSHAEIAIDDVFHWGGDYADLFVFDIYPYMMFDFRFGECSRLRKPRISQTHYAFGQMRALTQQYGKDLGFWFGTYNPAWFSAFLCPELQAMHWSEREMSTTAVAAGANYLLSGYKVPVDAQHWESLGEGLRLIQKTGGRLLAAPKAKANACMLFPRTQYVQLQEEYFNVGLSFELFLRAFGELDILHEEQVTDDRLGGYPVLVLFDVRLLPQAVADRIVSFVQRGGVVIADCVPQQNELRQPLGTMAELFGVKDAGTDRVCRTGCWVPHKTIPAAWFARPADAADESIVRTDLLRAGELGAATDIPIVSPRPCAVTTAEVLGRLASGQPGVVHRSVGSGHAYLLGFCLQDTYFRTWQDSNRAARDALERIVHRLPREAGVRPHVYSSNPDIEVSLRTDGRECFLFVISHEAAAEATTVQLAGLPSAVRRVTDLADDRPVRFQSAGATVEMTLTVPLGGTRILCLAP